jgi:hypothetical protein
LDGKFSGEKKGGGLGPSTSATANLDAPGTHFDKKCLFSDAHAEKKIWKSDNMIVKIQGEKIVR